MSGRFAFSTLREFMQERWDTTLGLLILLLYCLPFIISGELSNHVIHDNLDNNVAQYVAMANEHKLFSLNPHTTVETILGGTERMFLLTGFSFQALLFSLFEPYVAFLVNFITVHLIAFVGMMLLVKHQHLLGDERKGIRLVTALSFALIPFYTIYGLSVAGTPIVCYAAMNLSAGKRKNLSYLILALFPFYSSLFLVGVFIVGGFATYSLFLYAKSRILPRGLVVGLIILGVGYALSHGLTIYQFLFSKTPSHRSEMIPLLVDFEHVIDLTMGFFLELHYHVSQPMNFPFILGAISVLLGIMQKNHRVEKLLLLFSVNLAIALLYGIYSWTVVGDLQKSFPVLFMFQWNRAYYFSPLIWMVSLGISLSIIFESIDHLRYRTVYMTLIILLQGYHLWKYNVEFRETTTNLFSENKLGWSFRDFYDTELFTQLKKSIGRKTQNFRVASVGMHPAIAQFNGLQTIDGYVGNYPLDYKHEFRKIIGNELAKAPHLAEYFDHWGSRCYLFSSELSHNFLIDKNDQSVLTDLRFDFNHGPVVDYLISSVEIANPSNCNLRLNGTFTTDRSKWRIFLYEVKTNRHLSDFNSVSIIFEGLIPKDDRFKIFYAPGNTYSFSEDNSWYIDIKGSNQLQTITFRIPDSVKVNRLRLDIGRNPEQTRIDIKNLRLEHGGVVANLDLRDLTPNQFMSVDEGGVDLIHVAGQYNPYFVLEGGVIEKYHMIRQD